MTFENVYIVWIFIDIPRTGIADFMGQPHFFKCEWDDAKDDYTDSFILTPVSKEILELAKQQAAYFADWLELYNAGKTLLTSHPASIGYPAIFDPLKPFMRIDLTQNSAGRRARALFRDGKVEWEQV